MAMFHKYRRSPGSKPILSSPHADTACKQCRVDDEPSGAVSAAAAKRRDQKRRVDGAGLSPGS